MDGFSKIDIETGEKPVFGKTDNARPDFGNKKTNQSNKQIDFESMESGYKDYSILLYVFPSLLVIMLFLIYFYPSIDIFSYLVSFYSTEKVITFLLASLLIVMFFILLGNIVFVDKMFKKEMKEETNFYIPIISIFYAVSVAFIVVYITSDGYTRIINDPNLWIAFLVADFLVEAYPFYIGYKVFKNIKSRSI